MDFVDLGRLAFRYRKCQVHTVALNRRNRCHHLSAIQAAVDVLTLEFLLSAICQRLIERATIGQANIAHCLGQRVLVKFLGASKVHLSNCGTLFDHNHQHVAIGFQTHVLEQAQRKQRTNGRSTFFIAVVIAHTQGHGSKHGAGLHPLQTFNANILNLEGLQSPCRLSN